MNWIVGVMKYWKIKSILLKRKRLINIGNAIFDNSKPKMEIQFSSCKNTDCKWFDQAISIYIDSFPSNERHPIETIKSRVESGKSELYIGILSEKVICFALLWDFKMLDFILLDYFAIDKDHRGKQIGSLFFNYLKETVTNRKKLLVIESEHPNFGENQQERSKRINFYINNGSSILKDVPYTLPSLDNTEPTRMVLMVAAANKTRRFSNEQIIKLVKQLYVDLYNKSEDDEMLTELTKQVPNQVVLTKDLQQKNKT